MSPHVEALYESITAWLGATGEWPTAITLPRRHFLALAADLGVDDPGAERRAVLEYEMRFEPLREGADPTARTYKSRLVRVGTSFVFNGPGGAVTIREADEA